MFQLEPATLTNSKNAFETLSYIDLSLLLHTAFLLRPV